jgi:hypothetical protein
MGRLCAAEKNRTGTAEKMKFQLTHYDVVNWDTRVFCWAAGVY